ncbi:peptidylprolyl isomerase [Pelolinea submarina]|uniref:Parvulin-like peptidyl-prolyl isomerase n=1 Tax=Pelolinea submarina TaxID=913107 RepID=A0A347ZSX6_9CHLR|nr:peptidylprolyl isomerase [Pelolinea submarina]REG11018.1 parvulin-like peptidyl-prolyl isomerase [Pelolinea submarina]BBB48407.1 peptidyl-prolyl cis-trans isomerase C [Pelolinea submarina]
MSSTKKEEQAPKRPSIHSAREKKQNRIIIIGFIITAALIVGMVGYALLYDKVFKNHIAVAKVDHTRIDNDYFVNRVRLERNAYIQQYSILYAQYQMFGDSAEYQQYFLSQMQQVQSTLADYESFGETVLNSMVDDQVIAIEAKKMGIEVSDADVDELLMELFNYYPSGTPTPEPTTTPWNTPTVSEAEQALLGYTPTPVLEATEEVVPTEVVATETEEAVEATEAVAESAETADVEAAEETPEATATPAEVAAEETAEPTATPYTEELYQESYNEYITSLESVNVSEEYLRQYVYHYLLDQKVQKQIYSELPVVQEQVWARHILVETEDEAKDVLARLDAGEDWNALAAELSLDTSNNTTGGDLGWFPRGYMVEPFEEAAFALEVGKTSEPVETDYGWHIIQVVGHEDRALSADDYNYAQQLHYQNWLDEAKADKTIKINDVWKDIVPQDPSISADMLVN